MIKYLFIVLILASCSLKQQNITLKPVVIQPANLSPTEKKISVKSFDVRLFPQIIGVRYTTRTVGKHLPYINNYEDISKDVQSLSEVYLKGEGLNITQDVQHSGKHLDITLEVFKYEALKKQWFEMPRTRIKLYFTSKVKNEHGNVIYNGQHEYNVEKSYAFFQPRSKINEENISLAFSEGVRRIFEDQQLIEAVKGY